MVVACKLKLIMLVKSPVKWTPWAKSIDGNEMKKSYVKVSMNRMRKSEGKTLRRRDVVVKVVDTLGHRERKSPAKSPKKSALNV